MDKKEIICLKCKKKFVTEVDQNGIPYKKICRSCKQRNKTYGKGLSGTY